jgi:hypothetical protein
VSAAIPNIEPQQIRAGDTIKWTREFGDYPASDGWALAYRLINAAQKYDVNGSQVTTDTNGRGFLITIPAATSASFATGDYKFVANVTKGSERYTVAQGQITVLPNLAAQSSAFDGRTANQKVLDALEAMIAGRTDVEEYTIGTRSIKKMPINDLLAWRSVYVMKVRRERLEAGENFPSRQVGVRF